MRKGFHVNAKADKKGDMNKPAVRRVTRQRGQSLKNKSKKIVDVSTFPDRVAVMTTPIKQLTPEEKALRRKEQFRISQAKRRQALAESGHQTFQITVKATSAARITAARKRYQGADEEFLARALEVGARFIANSGNVKGGKVRE